MKIIKKLLKLFVFFIIISLAFYFGLYIYAKYMTKLTIKSANGFYIYDNEENLIEDLSDKWVSINDISPYVINATLAVEDKRFYTHSGFDYPRIAKSLYVNFTSGEKLQGASTITQQLAKNLFLSFDKTWERKIKEAWLTIQLETHYEKDEILEAYLNTINYGGIYGIENASKFYFHKSAKDLSLAEATILTGIPKSPAHYSPLVNEVSAKKRQLLILSLMVDQEFITENEKNTAYNEELIYYGTQEKYELKTLMYYQDAVMKELDSLEEIPKSFIETGGLKIYTYLDLEAQRILEEAMDNNITNADIQISGIMMDPNNGHIIALIGGRNYSTSQFNRAVSSKRQVGSTLKPFLYYAALENGFTSSTTFTSQKTTFVFSENKTYSPANYNDIYGDRPITMTAAIAYSDNIYAVKTHLFLGENTLIDILKRVGITSDLKPNPSLALGSGEMTLYEMVNAYATFANEGHKVSGKLIKRVEDTNGNVLYEDKEEKEAVLNSNLVYILNEALTSTYNYNFVDYTYPSCYDITSKLTNKYSIKTGTTDTDHLIFGYNKNIVIGIRTGYDDSRSSEITNSKQLRQMWADVAENYLEDKEAEWYTMPDNVVGTMVNPISGELAGVGSKNATMFYYVRGTEPNYKPTDLEELIPTIKPE